MELRAPSARSAQAFLAQLTAALAATEPVADGHALVRVERRQPPRRELGPRARAVVRIARVVPVYGLVLFLLGLVSPWTPSTAAATLVAGGVLGLAGGVPLWRAARQVRSLWLLRRRGVGVVGEVTGYVRIWDKGGHLWVFSRMSFTTVDGQRMRDVPSVVTVWGFADRAYAGPVDLVYDPEHPARASRPLTVGFAFRTPAPRGRGGASRGGLRGVRPAEPALLNTAAGPPAGGPAPARARARAQEGSCAARTR
ncbi:hypothetical protein LT493_10700 [Streptomyces tricolor]|nr:hypothetical protein [Streptomyces tricolor]